VVDRVYTKIRAFKLFIHLICTYREFSKCEQYCIYNLLHILQKYLIGFLLNQIHIMHVQHKKIIRPSMSLVYRNMLDA